MNRAAALRGAAACRSISFLAQGLMEAQSLLLLDLDNCTRCDACVRACADAHDGVTRLVREGLRFDNYLVATSCRQCLDPLCMVGCPVGSIRRRNSLEVIIEDWCIGCGLCAENCPYGNINLHPFNVIADDPGRTGQEKARWSSRKPRPAICAPTMRSRVASTPARTMPRIAWIRENSLQACWANCGQAGIALGVSSWFTRCKDTCASTSTHRDLAGRFADHSGRRDRRLYCLRAALAFGPERRQRDRTHFRNLRLRLHGVRGLVSGRARKFRYGGSAARKRGCAGICGWGC